MCQSTIATRPRVGRCPGAALRPSDLVLVFALTATILIVVPGPSVVFVIGRALSYVRGVALASVAGNTTGLLMVLALVSLALGVVVSESVVVFTVVKLVGAAYLVHLGIRAIRLRQGFASAETAAWRHRRTPPH